MGNYAVILLAVCFLAVLAAILFGRTSGKTARQPRYSEAVTARIVAMYKDGVPLAEIAAHAGTSVASVRAKLVHEKVYREYALHRLRAIEYGRPVVDEEVSISISVGDDCYAQTMVFLATHYIRVAVIQHAGEYRVLGGLVDVWSYGEEAPCRLDFFGDRLEKVEPEALSYILRSRSFVHPG